MKNIFVLMITLSAAVISGCQNLESTAMSKEVPLEENLFNKVDSPDLAKLILIPKTERLRVSRDPFRPLLSGSGQPVSPGARNTDINELKFLGVIKIGDESFALLSSQSKKGVFKEKDQFLGYTVSKIMMDQVVLNNGEEEKIVKRGEQNE